VEIGMANPGRVLIVAAFTVAGGAMGVGVAQATLEGAPTCGGSNHHVCLYNDNDYQGEIGDRPNGGGVQNIPLNYNDTMDSWWNETNYNARWYYDANGQGSCNNLAKSSRDANIGVFPSDELSSWATNGLC
jgi:Peptidase inhibitor family I36